MRDTGERHLPENGGEAALEHLHRYEFAANYCAGKTVLDIASGEGYGSYLLAKHAKNCIGIDVSIDAVEHARNKYQAENMSFVQGDCTKLPVADNLFDVVVSFETIEHHDQHERMLAEIKRVLKSDGILVISSPNKAIYRDVEKLSGEFHVKELYKDEFFELIRSKFCFAEIYGQKTVFASRICREKKFESEMSDYHFHIVSNDKYLWLDESRFFIVVASDVEESSSSDSLYFWDIMNSAAVIKYKDRCTACEAELQRVKNFPLYKVLRTFYRLWKKIRNSMKIFL